MGDEENNWGAIEMGLDVAKTAVKARSARGAFLMLQSLMDVLSKLQISPAGNTAEGRAAVQGPSETPDPLHCAPKRKKLTDDEVADMRARLVAEYDVGPLTFTCDECGARHTCGFAFDLYNTDGDCLAEK